MISHLKSGPLVNEEIRYDLAPAKIFSTDMIGLAPRGTATSDATWTILKVEYDGSGNLTREQSFSAVAWDDRASL